ncbi:MAG: mechanosensitive ion channel family protein [Persicimonas sp.]
MLLTVVAGCESPTQYFQSNPPAFGPGGQPTDDTTGDKPAADEAAADEAAADEAAADEAADEQAPVDVEVGSLESGTEKAERILQSNYEGFLERRELGFTLELPELVLEDLRALGERASGFPQRVGELTTSGWLNQLFPSLAVLLLLVLFALLDRTFLRWAKRWQAQIHVDFSRIATRLLRGLVLIAGRTAPLVALVALSYFPLQALADQAPWSLFLTEALWLGIAYRAIQAAIVISFSGALLAVAEPHASRLERFGRWVTRIIFGFLVVLAAMESFDYRQEAYNFTVFLLQLTVAMLPLYLFFARRSVMAMLPAYEGSRLYASFRRLLERYYRWMLAVTILLLLMRAAGFVTAATFILVRGYSIILLLVVTFVVGKKLREFLRRRTEAIDVEHKGDDRIEEAGPPQLAKSLEQLILVGGGALVLVVALELLAVRGAVVALLKAPLVVLGNVQISLFNVLAAGLVIFGTILAIKILKAVLNAKVYPALSVDVGVAYALNTLLSYVLVVVGFLMVLAAVGVNLSAIAVVLASLGVGIGFGLQTLTENLISGFIILFGRSVKKGDFITVGDTYGRVEGVGARSVVIRTPDNFDMLIPSKEIVGGQITNWTYRDTMIRARIDVGTSYQADPAHVREVLLEAASNAQFVLETPEPEVWLVGFGDSSVDFQLLVFFDCNEVSPARFKGLIYFDLWYALKEANIEIPFPQRDLHVRSAQVLPDIEQSMRKWKEPGGSADTQRRSPAVDEED